MKICIDGKYLARFVKKRDGRFPYVGENKFDSDQFFCGAEIQPEFHSDFFYTFCCIKRQNKIVYKDLHTTHVMFCL